MKKKEKLIGTAILCVLLAVIALIGYRMNSRIEEPIDESIFLEEESKG